MSQRTKFLLLLSLFLLPTAASFVVFYFFPPEKTDNYGELVSPIVVLPETSLSVMGDTHIKITDSLRGKWLVVTRDSGRCEAACQRKLYAMRQARLILGRERDRVQLVVLIDDDFPLSTELRKDYEGVVWIDAKSSSWLSLLPSVGSDGGRNYIYAADTLGNIFIRYQADPDIKKMSKDLLRVLKASQIG